MKAVHGTTFGILAAVVVLFAALTAIVCRTSSLISEKAEQTMKSAARESALLADRVMLAVETVTRNFGWVVGEHVADPDYMYRITRELVENNDHIVGSAVAFAPDFYKEKGRLFAPYTCISTNGQLKSFPLPYDYPSQEWYQATKEIGKAHWCEPYFDEGGGNVMMCTFAVPITNETGQVYAVLTADISLADMARHVASICPYPQSYAVMISCAGNYIVLPPQGHTFERSEKTITIREKTSNGWTIAIVCPMEDFLRETWWLVSLVVLLAVIGLLIVISILRIHIVRPKCEPAVSKRAEKELV